jgi:long-chain acyl-CoA synthetase
MITRLKFIFDNTLTAANALDKSIVAYGADFEILRFSGNQRHLGIDGNSLTLGELRRVVNRLSNYLRAIGVERFNRVATCKSGAVDYLILTLAILRCGAISVPINGRISGENLQKYLDYTGCSHVFVDSGTVGKLSPAAIADGRQTIVEINTGSLNLLGRDDKGPRLIDQSNEFTPVAIHDHDDVMIVHTSGTTGFPKGVLHGSHSIIRAAKGQLKIQPLTRNNRILLASPANHHITQAGIITNLIAGLPAYVPAGETPEQLLALISSQRISLMLAFPDIYADICALDLSRYDLSCMKVWMAGGDSSHEAHIRKLTSVGAFFSLFGRRLLSSAYTEFFGTSEVGFAALMKVSFSFTKRFQRYVGKPTICSPKVKIADAEGNPLPANTPGRLMVKGPTLFKGYWNSHDRLHGVYMDGWWWTGDVALKDKRGRYYHLDREVDVIYAGGTRVFSLPIEEVLLKMSGVHEVVVVSQQQGDRSLPCIIVQTHADARISENAIRQRLQQELPGIPEYNLRLIDDSNAIPRGLTGKVLKRELRATLVG